MMKKHKFCKYFPELEGEEFELLKEDIKEHGQMGSIVTYKGQVLDGWNRYKACRELGIEPDTEEFTGDDPLSYVVSLNIRRRHLNESQRAMLATEMEKEFAKDAEKIRLANLKNNPNISNRSTDRFGKTPEAETSRGKVATLFGVSGPTIQRAKRVATEAPERVSDIVSGKATVRSVDAELRAQRATEAAQKEIKKRGDKQIKEHPKFVKEYLNAGRAYKSALQMAIRGKERNLISSEAMQFIRNIHGALKTLMDELTEGEQNGNGN